MALHRAAGYGRRAFIILPCETARPVGSILCGPLLSAPLVPAPAEAKEEPPSEQPVADIEWSGYSTDLGDLE